MCRASKDRKIKRRFKVYKAQNERCFYCGKPIEGYLTSDHLFPKSKGFSLKNNTVISCNRCNSGKNDRLPYSCEIFAAEVIYEKLNETLQPRTAEMILFELADELNVSSFYSFT
jgi:CRISPR/Cas system Type II protein with McrA/HNH and RuvC-like nuclease domain